MRVARDEVAGQGGEQACRQGRRLSMPACMSSGATDSHRSSTRITRATRAARHRKRRPRRRASSP